MRIAELGNKRDTKRRKRLITIHRKDCPLDFSIKEECTVFSSEKICYSGVVQDTTDMEDFERQDFSQLLFRTTSYYSYPGSDLAPSVSLKLKAIDGLDFVQLGIDAKYFQNRVETWMISFCSLYQMLRKGNCPYFYLMCHSCSILFRGEGIPNKTDIDVVISGFDSSLKEKLQEAKIAFVEGDNAALISGISNVHYFYNFLAMNACDSDKLKGKQYDVPLLLSSNSFVFGTMKEVEFKSSYEQPSEDGSIQYTLRCKGWILPLSLHRLSLGLSKLGIENVKLHLKTDQRTTKINYSISNHENFHFPLNSQSFLQVQDKDMENKVIQSITFNPEEMDITLL